MLYNDDVCGLDEVKRQVRRCGKFGWSWSKQRKEPYRHTAIVLYFDRKPTFTINFRPQEGSNKIDAAFSECGSCVTIERVKNPHDGRTEYHDPFEEFPLTTQEGRKQATETIEQILSYEPGNYNLTGNNCRDFVDGVTQHVREKRKALHTGNYEERMNSVRSEDVNRYLGAGFGGMAVVGSVILAVSTVVNYFSGGNQDEEEQEKEEEEGRTRERQQHQ